MRNSHGQQRAEVAGASVASLKKDDDYLPCAIDTKRTTVLICGLNFFVVVFLWVFLLSSVD